jgi:hypothetical protein
MTQRQEGYKLLRWNDAPALALAAAVAYGTFNLTSNSAEPAYFQNALRTGFYKVRPAELEGIVHVEKHNHQRIPLDLPHGRDLPG